MIRHYLGVTTKVDEQITNESATLTIEELITLAIIAKALGGSTTAYKAIMDSAYGKV